MNTGDNIDKYLLIVNKNNPLTEERETWVKDNFEYVPYIDGDGESYMELETFKAYTALIQHMKRKYHIMVDSHSAGRTRETQEKVYEELSIKYGEEWARTHVATPGTSEHHTGLAFDLRFKFSVVPESLREQANTLAKRTKLQRKVFQLIEKEAVQFGLIKRYNEEKKEITGVKGELWHFRYVGVEHAKKMYEEGLCLEEYVELLKNKTQVTATSKSR